MTTTTTVAAAATADSTARNGFARDWVLKSAIFQGVPVVLPSGQVTLSLSLSSNGCRVLFHACNRMMGGMIVDDEISDTEAGIHFTPMPSTRMMPQPEFREVEQFIIQTISLMNKASIVVVANDNVQLLLEGPGGTKSVFCTTQTVQR